MNKTLLKKFKRELELDLNSDCVVCVDDKNRKLYYYIIKNKKTRGREKCLELKKNVKNI